MNNQKRLAIGLGLALGATVMATSAMAQYGDRDKDKNRGRDAQVEPTTDGFSMDEYLTALEKYAQPGERHLLLDPIVGEFNATVKMWMDTSAEPAVSYSKMKSKWVLGGRFVKEHYTSDFMGKKFEGIGMLGYDNYTKQYVSSWWDTMGTMTYQSRGTVDPTGKVFTFNSMYQDPAENGRMVTTKEFMRIINNDKYIMKMFRDTPDGEMIKVMEIVLTRVKEG